MPLIVKTSIDILMLSLVSGNRNCVFWRFLILAFLAENIAVQVCHCHGCHLLKIHKDLNQENKSQNLSFLYLQQKYCLQLPFCFQNSSSLAGQDNTQLSGSHRCLLVQPHLPLTSVLGITSSSSMPPSWAAWFRWSLPALSGATVCQGLKMGGKFLTPKQFQH